MDSPYIRVEDTGEVIPLRGEVTTIGRGLGVDVRLDDPGVSRLHAEIVRRGPYYYVADLGLSSNGTRVNGRPVARRVLDDGDVLYFGSARCRVEGLPHEELADEAEAIARVRGTSVNSVIADALAAEVERVRSDKDFTERATRLLARDKELLERLAR